jgi:hypothetical protein
MNKLTNFLENYNLDSFTPYLNNTSYLYGFFIVVFFIVFLILSFLIKKYSPKKEVEIEKKLNVDDIIDKKDIKLSEDNEFVDVLVAIEEEMNAIRELYAGGYISKGVYISETDRLYEKAKIFGL